MALRRLLLTASSTLALALLVAGCASGVGSETPGATPAPPAGTATPDDDDRDDLEAALLDEGRMFGIVSWGSSTCIPQVTDVSADGQTVSVTLADTAPENTACTADLAPRASIGALPEGVDPTKEIVLQVTYGQVSEDIDLDAQPEATGTPGTTTDFVPSAGWFDDDGLVLLTWGSSTCPPVVESVEGSGSEGTVTFAEKATGPCTMDMAPRGTIIEFGEDRIDDDVPFTLTLVGGALDGTLQVR